jgi:taurine dioxygenase
MSKYRTIEIELIAGALGAEIRGVDLSRELPGETLAELRAAWLEHLVIFFRDQKMEPAAFLAFARHFGEIAEYAALKGLPDYPLITPVIKLEHETTNFAGAWHSDTAYLEEPPMASMLIAREVPPAGGDTLFANMYLAYERLSPGMKKLLDGLYAVNSSARGDASRTREDRLAATANRAVLLAEHPVVRTHPETGRKALYVNWGHTQKLRDFTDQESAPILAFLFEHLTRPEFTCRFRWQPGSLALWDNRCTQHNPINDYDGYRRVMHRLTIKGDRPR